MPIREFRCEDGHVTEVFLHPRDDKKIQEIICPFCKKIAKRTMSTPKIHVPDGGWVYSHSKQRAIKRNTAKEKDL